MNVCLKYKKSKDVIQPPGHLIGSPMLEFLPASKIPRHFVELGGESQSFQMIEFPVHPIHW